ncbi:MAG: hypothetical protein J6U54_00550, partial [Clostridiales bacterium]|nr:hypothetical protein [Clostridiales bacterium]
KLTFFVEVSPSARFFALLSNLTSFAGETSEELKVTLDADAEFRKAYEDFLKRASSNVIFPDKS